MSRTLTQKKPRRILATSVAAMLGLGLLLGVPGAVADEYWDGTNTGGSGTANGAGGSGTWDNVTTNWVDVNGNNPMVYDPTQSAIFATMGGVVTLGNDIVFTALTFDVNGYSIEPGAGPFTLTTNGASGSITAASGVSVTIDAQIIDQGGGHSTLNLFGAGGTIVLTGSNTYSGGTNIGNAGQGPTVSISSDANLGADSGALTMDGGTLQTTASLTLPSARNILLGATGGLTGEGGTFAPVAGTTLEIDGTIANAAGTAGALTMAGAGTLLLSNASNSYSGGTFLNSGTLVISADGNLGAASGPLTFAGGKLETTSNITSSRSVTINAGGGTFSPDGSTAFTDSGPIALNDVLTMNGAGTLDLTGTITGTGGVTMSGTGTLMLAGAGNSYSGATLVSSGTLQAGAVNVVPSASAVTVNAGATFDLNNFSQNVGSISGGGAITLGSGTLTTGSSATAATTFSGVISGTGGLTQVGTKALTLSGANTYTGATTVNGGFLIITPSLATPKVLNSSSALVVGGGQFQMDGLPTPTTQVLKGLTVNAGASTVAVMVNTPGVTTTLDLRGTGGTLGITRNPNGFVDFDAINGTLGVDAIILTHQANDASGIIGTWATVNGGSGFATVNNLDEIVPFTGYVNIAARGDTIQDNPNSNVRINSPGTTGPDVIAQPLTRINSLTQNSTTASVIDTSPGELRLGPTGGIIITPGSAALTIGTAPNSGVLSAGEDTQTVPAVMTLTNDSGNGSLLTINSVIADNGKASVSVRVDGTGTTVFAGKNTYTGSTTIFGGTLQMAAVNSLPRTSAIVVDTNGTLALNSFSQSVGSIADGPNGGGTINLGTGTLTTGNDNTNTSFSGVIAGTGLLVKTGTGTQTLSGNSTYSGGTTLAGGGLIVNSNTGLGAGTITITSSNSPTTFGSTVNNTTLANPISVKGNFSISTSGFGSNFILNGPIDLNGGTRTITGLTNGGQPQFNGGISNGGITFNTVFSAGTGEYVAFIYDGAPNTYTGLTTVNTGAFLVFEGATPGGGTQGNVEIEGNGVVDYLGGAASQLSPTATVTVNSGGNTIPSGASTQFFGGLDLFNSSGETIGTLNGSVNGVVALGAANLSIGAGDFEGTIFDGQHAGIAGGQITKIGSGTLFLSGANFYTGGTTINAGILQINSDASLGININTGASNGPLTFNGGTLEVVPNSLVVSTRSVVLNTTATMQIDQGAETEFDGVVSGTGPLVKTGPGDLFLGGANTFTGGTMVNGGNLFLTGTGTLVSPVTVNKTGTFILEKGATLTATPVTVNAGGTFNNQATFSAATAVVVKDPTGVGTVVNSGTLTGTTAAIDASTGGGVKIVNFGTINGPILLGPGANTIVLATQMRPISPSPLIQGGAGHNDTLELAGSGVDSFNAGEAMNFEFLNKVGGGLWTLTGTGNFPRGTTISGGTLAEQGTLVSNVQILPGGTLSGIGSISGNVFNSGIVMPGTVITNFPTTVFPGTLSVKGSYVQNPSGVLSIQVNGNKLGQYSQLSISGHAQLGGALFLQEGPEASLKFGQKLIILSATAGVSGTFAGVSNPFDGGTIVVGKVVYEPNDVALEGVQGSFKSLDSQFHLTGNQKEVAAAIDTAAGDPRAAKLVSFLDNRPLKQLPADFDHIAPEEIASVFRIGVSLSDVQARNIQRRTADLRAGASGFNAAGFQSTTGAAYGNGAPGAGGPTGEEGKTASAPSERRWGTFITGVGDFVHVGNSANAEGYDLNTGGVTVGADYKLNDHLAAGVTAGYTGTDANLTENGRLLVNGGKVGAYGTYYTGGFYADAAVSGGYNSYSIRRSALQGDAFGSTSGGEVDALAGAGYDWKLDALTIGPTASFQYTYMGIDSFTEHASLAPLHYGNQHESSYRSSFGLRAAYDWKVGGVIVRPEAELAWQHEYGDRNYTIDSTFASGAGSSFSVADTQLGRDSFLFGGGVSVLWNPRTSTYLFYDADLLKKEYYSQSVTGGLRMNF